MKFKSSLPASFFSIAKEYPEGIVYEFPDSETSWTKRDYKEVSKRISSITNFLKNQGVQSGDSVAVISGTRPEWMEIDLAILSLGAITVSVYPSLPADDARFILDDSKASSVFVENQEQADKVLSMLDNKSFKLIIAIEEVAPHPQITPFSEVMSCPPSSEPYVDSAIIPDTIASIVYTSGTTSTPKGVVQTHGNHLANVAQAEDSGMFGAQSSMFLFLPLAHSFARLIAYLGFLTSAVLKFASVADKKSSKVDLARVTREIKESNAEVLPTVPRVFEKIKDTLESRAHGKSMQAFLLQTALKNARLHFRAYHYKEPVTLWHRILFHALSPIRLKIKKALFGPEFSHAVSGGAKLPREVNEFFWSIGIEIYEGYGLTETCVATNVNRKEKNKFGSVGPALKGVETKIAEDGEILFKGPNITKQYHNRPDATRESWDPEGWFHTGDVGHLDDDGFLFITDRKKELIVTAGGKKVPPQKIENLLTKHPLINQALYCGDEKPYCVALVTLNQAIVHQIGVENVDKKLDEIKKEVNSELSSFEAVKKIKVLPEEFTVDNGLLTPTLKMKRKVILKRFEKEFESLYSHKE